MTQSFIDVILAHLKPPRPRRLPALIMLHTACSAHGILHVCCYFLAPLASRAPLEVGEAAETTGQNWEGKNTVIFV